LTSLDFFEFLPEKGTHLYEDRPTKEEKKEVERRNGGRVIGGRGKMERSRVGGEGERMT